MIFWIIALVFTLIIAVICFYPLLKNNTAQKKDSIHQRDELNKAFYLDRLQELAQEEALGLHNNSQQLKLELQQALLDDIPAQNTNSTSSKHTKINKIWFSSALLVITIIASLAYFHVGAWQTEHHFAQTEQKLPYFYQRLSEEQQNPMSDSELQEFATALRLYLHNNPQGSSKWWLLGQLAMNLNQGQLAHDSYAKAYQLAPDNEEYKLSYARILMFSEDPSDKFKGEELLKALVRANHTNVQALSLLAFHYFEQEDYKMAIVSWATMLKLLPKSDPRIPLLEKSIRSARDALEEQEK
ncbi:c-type cytochrome biogenesis protein CcmI [Volucribacter amazonae]|uniref:C-type cytochrome biogenesis protein CcmI n=1 Tax=Volucribacter amazonae TaxID=256731 RepID=A0A9X4PIA9_9PAST|nr:c-type cytochrome biogenesis protein CcmI [Volucribacter amazonae]MDG6895750.1 c-type cytochrome biogenesis protein CcmI [Volucribacter amazonae]